MSDDKPGRKLLWWNMPIGIDDKADVGRRMMRAVAVWAAVIVGLVAIPIVVRIVF